MTVKPAVFKIKGMNRDTDVSIFTPEYAFENMNIRIEAVEENTQLGISNEKGNLELPIYDETGTNVISISGVPIGYGIVDENLILFTTDAEGATIDNPINTQNKFQIRSCVFGGIINNKLRLYINISEIGNPTRLSNLTVSLHFSIVNFNATTGLLQVTDMGTLESVRGTDLKGVYYDFSLYNTANYIIIHELNISYNNKTVYYAQSATLLNTLLTSVNIVDVISSALFPTYSAGGVLSTLESWDTTEKFKTGYFVYGLNGTLNLESGVYTTSDTREYKYAHFDSAWSEITNLLPSIPPIGDLFVGVVGFKMSDNLIPITSMTIGDADITGVVGESKIIYVNVEPNNATDLYNFGLPTYESEFLSYVKSNDTRYIVTLLKETNPYTTFIINHNAGFSASCTIYIEDFLLTYELLHPIVGNAIEIPRLSFSSSGENNDGIETHITCNSDFIVTTPSWIVVQPSLSYYTGNKILMFSALANDNIVSRSDVILLTPKNTVSGFTPVEIEVYQETSSLLLLSFVLNYTIPVNELGIIVDVIFTNNSAYTIRLEEVWLHYRYNKTGQQQTFSQSFYPTSANFAVIDAEETLHLETNLLASNINTMNPTETPSFVAVEFIIGNTTYGGVGSEQTAYQKRISLENKE